MDDVTIDIAPVRPDVWVAFDADQPEGGFIIRRFERWTCTCVITDSPCRHVRAARSRASTEKRAVRVLASVRAAKNVTLDAATTDAEQPKPIKHKRTAKKAAKAAIEIDESDSDAIIDEIDGEVEVMPRGRRPRPVKVSDRSALHVTARGAAA